MSYYAYSSTRHILINYTPLVSLVPASNIIIGYGKVRDKFPCVTLSQVGGDSYGRLGYNTSIEGTKDRIDTWMMQIDIYERDNIEDLELISDEIQKALLSGSICRKVGDVDGYEDVYNAYRKTQTYTVSKLFMD